MTEFTHKARHYCRNPKCRSKLPAPVSNPREGFCAPGCRRSFYLRRCLVCEGPLKRTREDQKVCRKARCRSAWRARRYIAPQAGKLAPETPDFISPKGRDRARVWVQIAGPPLTSSQLHCATIPDGPSGTWAGGEYRRIEAKNRAALRAAEQAEIEANGYFTTPEWREAVSPDGVRSCITRFRPPVGPNVSASTGDDLGIPPFLRRARSLAP